MMKKLLVGLRYCLGGLIVLSVMLLTNPIAMGANYDLKFFKPGDNKSDFNGKIEFRNKPQENAPSNCQGTLTIDGEEIKLNGTHWWPPRERFDGQAGRFYSVTLAGKSSDQDADYRSAYISLLLSFNKVAKKGSPARWGIAGQALVDDEGKMKEYLVIGRLSR